MAANRITALCGELRILRLAQGLPQAFVAQAVGVDVASVCNWENSSKTPGARNLAAWAECLGVRLTLTGDVDV